MRDALQILRFMMLILLAQQYTLGLTLYIGASLDQYTIYLRQVWDLITYESVNTLLYIFLRFPGYVDGTMYL